MIQVFMPPIVLFIIGFNIFLSLACLWLVWNILQWRKGLVQMNQGLTIVHASLTTRSFLNSNPALTNLQSQVQEFHSTLKPQIFPVLQLLSKTYRMQRLWVRLGKKRPSLSSRQSAINPRRR